MKISKFRELSQPLSLLTTVVFASSGMVLTVIAVQWSAFIHSAHPAAYPTFLFSILIFPLSLLFIRYKGIPAKHNDTHQPENSLSYKEALLWVFLLGVAFYLRYVHLFTHSIWLDEYLQAMGATKEALMGAVSQQQPPLDYYFTAFSSILFGLTEFALRVVPFIFSVGAVFIAILIGRLLKFSLLLNTLFVCSFIFNPWLIRYSADARPISTGVFFTLLFIYIACYFFKGPFSIKKFSLLLASQFYFLMSVGLQPVLILGYSAFAALTFLFFKSSRSKALWYVLSTTIALLLFSPIQWLAYSYSQHRMSKTSTSSIADKLFEIDWVKRFVDFFNFSPLSNVFFAVTILALLLVLVKRFKKPTTQSTPNAILPLFFSHIFLFPFIFIFSFLILIDWPLNLRYYLCFLPFFTLFTFFSLHQATFSFNFSIFNKLNKYLVPALFLMILGLTAWHSQTYVFSKYHVWNLNNREAFQHIKSSKVPGSYVFMLTLARPGRWVPPGVTAGEIYYPEHEKDGVYFSTQFSKLNNLIGHEQDERIARFLLQKKITPKRIYLLAHNIRASSEPFFSEKNLGPVEGVTYTPLEHFTLIQIDSSEDTLQAFIDYLTVGFNKAPNHVNYFRLPELLFYLNRLVKNEEGAEKYYSHLQKLNDENNDILKKQLEYIKHFNVN